MKKLTAYVCAAALLTASLHMSLPTVYAMTKVNNAQTAVESSMDELLTSLDKTDINESFTREDLENLIFEACNYTVDGRVGVGFMVDKFRIVSPTGGNAGYMSADVIIYLDDAEEAYSVKKEFSSSGGLSINDGNDDSDSAGNTSNENTAETKKSIVAAKSAINAAIWEFEVSNNTTADDILNMAKAAVESGVTVTLDKSDFKLVKASTTIEGTVSATLTLDCGGISDRVPVAKTIPVEVTETSTAIDEDRKLMGVAVGEVVFTNSTTEEDILAAASISSSVVLFVNTTSPTATPISFLSSSIAVDVSVTSTGIVFATGTLSEMPPQSSVSVAETVPSIVVLAFTSLKSDLSSVTVTPLSTAAFAIFKISSAVVLFETSNSHIAAFMADFAATMLFFVSAVFSFEVLPALSESSFPSLILKPPEEENSFFTEYASSASSR